MSITPGAKRPATLTPPKSPSKKAKRLTKESARVLMQHNSLLELLMKEFDYFVATKDSASAKAKAIEINDVFNTSMAAATHLSNDGWIQTINNSQPSYMKYLTNNLATMNQKSRR